MAAAPAKFAAAAKTASAWNSLHLQINRRGSASSREEPVEVDDDLGDLGSGPINLVASNHCGVSA